MCYQYHATLIFIDFLRTCLYLRLNFCDMTHNIKRNTHYNPALLSGTYTVISAEALITNLYCERISYNLSSLAAGLPFIAVE